MIGIYLSGTGNTEHCIKKLLFLLDKTVQAVPMEQKDAGHLLSPHDFIVFAYPVQFCIIARPTFMVLPQNKELLRQTQDQ